MKLKIVWYSLKVIQLYSIRFPQAFNIFDNDRNGSIDISELSSIMEKLGQKLETEQLKVGHGRGDADNDGDGDDADNDDIGGGDYDGDGDYDFNGDGRVTTE